MDKYEWMGTASLELLLRRDDGNYVFHRRACGVYASWIRGYSAEDIAHFDKMGVEDVRADIEHIEAILPVKTFAGHLDGRNKILKAKAKAEERRRYLSQNLSKSARTLLKEGINPWDVLRAYCKAVGMKKRPRPARRRAALPEPIQEAKDGALGGGPALIDTVGAGRESDQLPQGERGPAPITETGE